MILIQRIEISIQFIIIVIIIFFDMLFSSFSCVFLDFLHMICEILTLFGVVCCFIFIFTFINILEVLFFSELHDVSCDLYALFNDSWCNGTNFIWKLWAGYDRCKRKEKTLFSEIRFEVRKNLEPFLEDCLNYWSSTKAV